jgi:hypothetical protein
MTDLFDALVSPKITLPAMPNAPMVLAPEVTLMLTLSGRKIAYVLLHPFCDGCWMWAVGWMLETSGSEQAVSAKWGRFAPDKASALHHAKRELLDGIGNSTSPRAAAIARWVERAAA